MFEGLVTQWPTINGCCVYLFTVTIHWEHWNEHTQATLVLVLSISFCSACHERSERILFQPYRPSLLTCDLC